MGLCVRELTQRERIVIRAVPKRYAAISPRECRVFGFWDGKNNEILEGVVIFVLNLFDDTVWSLRHARFVDGKNHDRMIEDGIFKLHMLRQREKIKNVYCWLDERVREGDLYASIFKVQGRASGTAYGGVWSINDLYDRSFMDRGSLNREGIRYVGAYDTTRARYRRNVEKLGCGTGLDFYQWSMESMLSRICVSKTRVVSAMSLEVNDDSDIMLHMPGVCMDVFREKIVEQYLRDVLIESVTDISPGARLSVRVLKREELDFFKKICGEPEEMTRYTLYKM